MSKSVTLFLSVLIAFSASLVLPSGNAIAQIDGGYVGTATCQGCHPDAYADFEKSGHPYKFRQTNGADCGAGDCDLITNVLTTPAVAGLNTLTNNALILDDGTGNLDWSVVQYIIGGFGWKARFGIRDATDADGDAIDDTGYVWVGPLAQYNMFTDAWVSYEDGKDKEYNCGICHNTNGTRDMLASRTEPWASIPGTGAGFTSQWTFDGVQCEACHGPGVTHVSSPLDPFPTDTTKGLCGTCHNRSGGDDHGADTKSGYIKHHEQYNEMVGNSLEPGVHAFMECGTCHDPHKRSHTVPDAVATALDITDNDQTAQERFSVGACESCHTKSVRFHNDLQCIDCHMPAATKSASAETGTYGKVGDVKTHIFAINPDPNAEDTAASPNSVTGTNVAHNYLTLNYVCGKCHDDSLSTFAGVALTMPELGALAPAIHTSPVRQNIGFPDIEFNAVTEAECRECHGTTDNANRHHLLYGSTQPAGECSTTTGTCNETMTDCVGDADCPAGEICVGGTPGPCYTDEECATPLDLCNVTGDVCPDNPEDPCPRSYTGQVCGQPFCYGGSSAPNADPSGMLNCLSCHDQDTSGGVTNFLVERDCSACHVQNPNSPTVHHDAAAGGLAKSGQCVACHGDSVDDPVGTCSGSGDDTQSCVLDADCDNSTGTAVCVQYDDGHYVPTYTPSLVTPSAVAHNSVCENTGAACTDDTDCNVAESEACISVSAVGACNYCHDAGHESESGLDIVDNHDTHHHAGIHKNSMGGSERDKCNWCHFDGRGDNDDPAAIRTCENCHGPEALHNIQADDGGDGVITVGGEMAGYGHIGADDPGSASDCWGCHGFGMASSSAPFSGPVVPQIDSLSPQVLTAGTAAQISLSGSGMANVSGSTVLESTVVLTTVDGTTIDLGRDSITPTSLTATVGADVPAGTYAVQAVKNGTQSNAAILTIVPGVDISQVMCDACSGSMTITGSGFGDAPPAGAEAYINVVQDGVVLDIISWQDDVIEAIAASCNGGSVTVNTLYGSATE